MTAGAWAALGALELQDRVERLDPPPRLDGIRVARIGPAKSAPQTSQHNGTFDEGGGFYGFVLVRGGDAGQPGVGSGGEPGTAVAGGRGGGSGPARGEAGAWGRGGDGASGGGGGGGGLFGGGGGCSGSDAKGSLCLDSQPGSGGGGSSLVPEGGTFALSNVFEPSVTIVVIQ